MSKIVKIPKEDDNIDALVRSNGVQGITELDNQGAGNFQGYTNFFSGYDQLEGAFGRGE